MKPGQLLLQRAHQVDVEPAVELGGKAGLDAHLGRAELPRFAGAAHDLLGRQEVALFLAVVAAERAEGAVLDADVGEVDVAVHDVGDDVAGLPLAQLVGRGHQGVERRAPARRTGSRASSAQISRPSSARIEDARTVSVRG